MTEWVPVLDSAWPLCYRPNGTPSNPSQIEYSGPAHSLTFSWCLTMSSFSFKQAFGREKPHSSITDWVEILTGSNIAEEAYDGIPELVESINLQVSGPNEASRALRKKLKHGNAHQQYRALVLLKALVENCGAKFQAAFSDSQLVDTFRLVASDLPGEKRVKKKLRLVLAGWREQYKDDPSMAYFASLYKQCRIDETRTDGELYNLLVHVDTQKEMQAKKAKAKEERQRERELRKAKEQEERNRPQPKPKVRRVPFDFERDKPKVQEAIVQATQASSNLINAITLVNLEKETLEENGRVQECLAKAKQAMKIIIRFTQLVENEDFIGTLIETNERVVMALETYNQIVSAGQDPDDATKEIASSLAATTLETKEVKATNPTHASYRSQSPPDSPSVHPDLEDLQFGALGQSSNRLPPPIQPSKRYSDEDNEEAIDNRGSLSDFSDYESSDGETRNVKAGPSTARKSYVAVSDDEGDIHRYTSSHSKVKSPPAEEDPFADPFADELAVKK
ncbi:hypothetical protein FA15DRAFT_35563 [Coprinopsis marcescibilis]|uniref:VHS domain-containing protein n=1 Tax=Coprinopsis marcescibilis TaxID=230819 RepID=A0A5C3LDL6_COPMA|nr:hypothetical protein FA15DRAFT_35563 [Coprinopsis marcescibilis]